MKDDEIIDFDLHDKDLCDKEAIRRLMVFGWVWYKKENIIYYLSKEWIENATKQGLI